MTRLVDEKRLKEFKDHWTSMGYRDWVELCESYSLALAVVRAAQEIRKSFSVKTDDDLRIALDPFSQPRSDAGTQGEK